MAGWQIVLLFFICGVLEHRLRAIEHQAKQANETLIEIEATLRSLENRP